MRPNSSPAIIQVSPETACICSHRPLRQLVDSKEALESLPLHSPVEAAVAVEVHGKVVGGHAVLVTGVMLDGDRRRGTGPRRGRYAYHQTGVINGRTDIDVIHLY